MYNDIMYAFLSERDEFIMNISHDNDLLEGSLFKKILLFSLPIMFTNILQLMYNAADMMVVGQWSGPQALAAVSSTGSVTALMVNLFSGLAVGANVILSRYIGADNHKDISETVHTAIFMSVILGTVLMFASLFFVNPLLVAMSCPADVLPYASIYLKIYFFGSPAILIYNYGANILRTEGDTKSPLYFLIISGFVNVVLNIILVAGFHMDTIGVAIATLVSQYMSAAFVIMTLLRRTSSTRLYLSRLKIHRSKLKGMLYFGIPASLQSLMFSISNVLIQSSVNSFGTIAVAGSGAASNIDAVIYGMMNAFVQAALIYTGYCVGSNQYRKIKTVAISCIKLILLAWFVSTGLIFIFKEPLLKIFIPDSPESLPFAYQRLMYLAYPYCLCAIMETMASLLRGLGKSIMPMIITLIGVCIMRVVWIYFILPLHRTLGFLYVSYPVSWLLTSSVLFIFFLYIYKKKLKGNQNEN